MKIMKCRIVSLLIGFLAFQIPSHDASADALPFGYELVDVSALTGLGSKLNLRCINGAGVMAGTKETPEGQRPVTLTVDEDDGYTLIELPVPVDFLGAIVNDISENGMIVGAADRSGDEDGFIACYWKDGQYFEIGFLSPSPVIINGNEFPQVSTAFAISPDGSRIVGRSRMNAEDGTYLFDEPFEYEVPTGTISHIPTPEGFPVLLDIAGDVNDAGDIVLQAILPPSADRYLVLLSGGVASRPLHALAEPEPNIWGFGHINRHGDIASTVLLDSEPDIVYAAHLTTSAGTVRLPRLPDGSGGFDKRGDQNGILDSRVVYGSSGAFETDKFATLWHEEQIHKVADLATEGSDPLRQFSEVLGMNESGHGVLSSWAEGSVSAERFAYYMRPVFPPGSFVEWYAGEHGSPFYREEDLQADDDHDGIPILFDYALAGGAKPLIAMEDGDSLYRFDRIASHDDIVLTIHISNDLIDWDPAATFSNGSWTWDPALLHDFEVSPSGDLERVEATLDPGATKLFLKLEASLP